MKIVTEFLNELADKGVRLSVEGDQLICYAPGGSLTKEIRDRIADYKPKIISFLKGCGDNFAVKDDTCKVAEFPLSVGQKGLYILQKLNPGMSAYNVPLCFKIKGKVNVEALEKAWDLVLDRYPILSARIVEKEGVLFHRLENKCRASFRHQAIDFPDGEQLLRFLQANAKRVFDLNQGPLSRINLFFRDNQNPILLITVHHIVFDGTSSIILLRSLFDYYQQLCEGKSVAVTQQVPGYQEFVAWEEAMLASAEGRSHAEFWQQQLDGDLPGLELLPDLPRPASLSYEGKTLIEDLSVKVSGRVHEFCRSRSLQPAVLFLAVFQLLLHRYTRQEEVIVGMPVMGRAAQKFAEEMGYFINMVPLRTHCGGQLKAGEFFRKVQGTMLDALYHSSYPFPLMLDKLKVKQADKNPVFQVSYAFQNFVPRSDSYSIEAIKEISQEGDFDLGLEVYEDWESFGIHIKYNPELYTCGMIKHFFEHYCVLLEEIFKSPDLDIHEYSILSATEKRQLLVDYNDTRADYPQDKCIHQLFVEQVKQNPEKTAVEFEGEQLSYQQLYDKSHALALYLQSLRVKPDSPVGLCVERSLDMIVGILGIAQAGGAYIPLDPDYPDDRLAYMLEDSQAAIVLTQEKLQGKLTGLAAKRTKLIALDQHWPEISAHAADLKAGNAGLRQEVEPAHLAYIIYTSGSTGKPKGVMVEHRSLANFLAGMQDQLAVRREDIWLAVTTLSFDIAGLELMLPLTVGASLVLTGQGKSGDGIYLQSLLSNKNITIMQATPATWQLLLAGGWQQKNPLKILCGGEALTEKLGVELLARSSQVWNVYGPTETTVWSTAHKLSSGCNPSLIGRPIANTQIYILDEKLAIQPIGIPGELYIGGAGLARGYLNQPELTDERFLPNPFSNNPGDRLYKTGDLARWLPDGNLDFIGRIDNQVKLRGFRIELGEIEHQLSRIEGVEKCAVLCREDKGHDKRLVAYVVPSTPLRVEDESALTEQKRARVSDYIERLKGSLPAYMVPGIFVFLEKMPLTPNGKMNRKALPPPEDSDLLKQAYVAPRNETEEKLCAIWEDALGVEKVGIHDNFFELGGHSLLLMQLISKMEKIGIELLVEEVMRLPTIHELCQFIESRQSETSYHYTYKDGDPIYSLPNRQLLFKSTFQHHWNVSAMINITNIRVDILETVLKEVLLEHEGLRHVFYLEDSWVKERVLDIDNAVNILQIIDLTDVENEEERTNKIEMMANDFQAALNLGGPLYKFVLFDCGHDQPARFLWIIHHSVLDGYSINIFYQEMFVRYLSRVAGVDVKLPAKTNTIIEWGNYLHKLINSERGEKDFDYWISRPWDEVGVLMDYPENVAANKSDDIHLYGNEFAVVRKLDEKYSDLLLIRDKIPKNIGEADIILTAFASAISSMTNRNHVRVDMVTYGRDKIMRGISVDRTIGWFTDWVPVVIHVDSDLSVIDKIISYKHQIESIPNSGLTFNGMKYLSDNKSVRDGIGSIPWAEVNINLMPEPSVDMELFSKLPISVIAPASESHGAIHMDGSKQKILWASYVQVSRVDDRYELMWLTRDSLYKRETVEKAVDLWAAEIVKIIDAFIN